MFKIAEEKELDEKPEHEPQSFCPILAGRCRRDRCQWYFKNNETCAVFEIAERLGR